MTEGERLDDIEREGYRFSVTIAPDYDMREPWKEHYGHGVVSEWTARAKAPGERVLNRDHERLRAWCRDEWTWVGVVVELLDAESQATRRSKCLWGIESDAGEYLNEVAGELVDELIADLGGADSLTIPLRAGGGTA